MFMIALTKDNMEWSFRRHKISTINYKKLSLNMKFPKIRIKTKIVKKLEFQTVR